MVGAPWVSDMRPVFRVVAQDQASLMLVSGDVVNLISMSGLAYKDLVP